MKLSLKGLQQINLSLYENDFTFLFNGREFACPTFIAEFISQKVSKMRKRDPTINKMQINFEIKHEETLRRLNSLIRGCDVEDDNNLNNDELVNLLNNIGNEDSISPDKELSIDNVIGRLKYKQILDFDTNNEIEFIAEHFEEMKNFEIGNNILPQILDSSKLKLHTEKSLLDFIIEQIEKDKSNVSLIRFIHCEYLSKGEEIEEYIKLIDSIDDNEIIGSLWPLLRRHFIIKETKNTERFTKPKGIEFNTENGAFNGIIKYLSDKCGGNVIDKRIVDVTSSSNSNIYKFPLRSVVQEEGDWSSSNIENSWLKFDFKDRRVKVNAYSLRTNSINFGAQPKSWYLEGSNDNSSWKVIDQKNNQECMRGYLIEKTFDCASSNEEYRYLRFRRIEHPWGGDWYHLPINRVEFFGELLND